MKKSTRTLAFLWLLALLTTQKQGWVFKPTEKKRFRKSDFQWHLCSFITWDNLKNSRSTIGLRLIKERGHSGSVQGKTLSGGATTPSAMPGKKSLQEKTESDHCKRQCKGLAAIQRKDLLVLFCE